MQVALQLLLCCFTAQAIAQSPLRIEITGVGTRQIPIAIAPLDASEPSRKQALTIADVIRADLTRSGVFSIVDAGTPDPALNERSPVEPLIPEWKQKGAEALSIGSTAIGPDGRLETRFILVDISRGLSLGGLVINAAASELEARRTGHRIADFIYEKLTGEPGFFATRLAFVRKDGELHSLVVSDSDGQNTQVALRSKEPIISLSWSPDGTRLAYVSFEERNNINKPIVYVHTLATGRRTIVANEKGSNSSPAWSPDGKRLAVVLTRDGNSQIYTVNADGSGLRRVTRTQGIDTEPTFTPNGSEIYFTSDRGGSAQIYRVSAEGGEAKRVTFGGPFNARPQISPDGKNMAYIARRDKNFRVAVMDLASKQETLVSQGPKDDSPSFAPNSRWVIYSSRLGERNILSAVSLDGKIRTRLSAEGSEVKGPAWGRLP
ncbi:MAG: Tol-Pal system protein TolB [Burkholderiaceae bacterium]|nr:Tol-Pal system protein TolB [Burkholderiaceae bacterium]